MFWSFEKQTLSYEHPDAGFDEELCAPLVHDQSFEPKFEALSYAWGSLTRDKPIHVVTASMTEPASASVNHVSLLRVGSNLDNALRHLRLLEEPRTLWMDAICINQDDLEERKQQVQRMGDVFSLASKVVAYVGQASETSRLAAGTFQFLGSQVEISDDGWLFPSLHAESTGLWRYDHQLPYDQSVWTALEDFLSRLWFSRLWVGQEITLASVTTVIKCGQDEILYYYLRRAIVRLRNGINVPHKLQRLTDEKQHIAQGAKYLTFQDLLNYSRSKDCTVPHDKIYGQLNLMSARMRESFRPSYTEPFSRLYKDVVLTYSNLTNRVELLAACYPPDGESDLPSWIPDWRGHSTSLVKMSYGFQAAGMSKSSFTHVETGVLEVLGVQHGVVSRVSDEFDGDEANTIEKLQGIEPANLTSGTYPTGESKVDAWLRTLRMDDFDHRFPESHSEKLDDWKKVMLPMMLSSEEIQETSHLFPGMVQRLSHAVLSHVDNDYFGVYPAATQAGDRICVLLGCWCPLILRPTAGKEFQVIGRCYIHGLMDSEALLGPLPLGWVVQQHLVDGAFAPQYLNTETGDIQLDDPRLGPLPPEWTRVQFERSKDDPEFVDYFKNSVTGEIVNSDPRLDVEALKQRGVKLERFRLV